MTSNGNGKSKIPGSHPGEPNRIWAATIPAPFEVAVAVFFAIFGILSLALGGALVPGSLDILRWLVLINWQAASGLGGVLTALGRWNQADRVEQSGLALMLYAFVLYGIVLGITAGFTATAAVGLLASFAVGAGIRMWVLHQGLKAKKIAGTVQYDRDHSNGDSPT